MIQRLIAAFLMLIFFLIISITSYKMGYKKGKNDCINKKNKTMGTNTSIQWTDHTINFWTGCKKVSPGCKYCYMYRDKDRYGIDPALVMQTQPASINKVLKIAQPGDKIFTCSWSDFFIQEADQWRSDAWKIIEQHPQFIWQILTKRPERIQQYLPHNWGNGWPHVWLGVSIESDAEKHRLATLQALKTNTSTFKTFVSYEPAIGYLDLLNDDVITSVYFENLDWLIAGGESGNDTGKYLYRPCSLDWLENIVRQCQTAGVPVFVKQLGTYLSKELGLSTRHGGNIAEFPKILQVRQFPK